MEEYWDSYLSDSGRLLYGGAARVEARVGTGYSFEDIAAEIGRSYESVKSDHRNSGRMAARWRRERGEAEPIGLVFDGEYGPQAGVTGERSRYRLPDGVALKILGF